MNKMLMIVFAVSLTWVAIADNNIRYGGPFVSPLIAKNDSLYGSGSGFAPSWTDKTTTTMACAESTDFHNISVGDQVNIRYEERGGRYIASLGDSSFPLMACNLR